MTDRDDLNTSLKINATKKRSETSKVGTVSYRSSSMTCSSTDFGGLTRDSGNVAIASSGRFSSSRKVGFWVLTYNTPVSTSPFFSASSSAPRAASRSVGSKSRSSLRMRNFHRNIFVVRHVIELVQHLFVLLHVAIALGRAFMIVEGDARGDHIDDREPLV